METKEPDLKQRREKRSQFLTSWRIVGLCILVSCAIGFGWWALSGFPLEGKICEGADCEKHNIVLSVAWNIGKAVDHWSAAITAIATIFVAWFTWTLWQSSEKMWVVTKLSAEAAQKSAETAEKALFAAYRPLVTITELELRSESAEVPRPHIRWGMRNSGVGIAVVHTFDVLIVLHEIVDGQASRTRSRTKKQWTGAIEPGETAAGNAVTTPTLEARCKDILDGKIALYLTFEIDGQDLFLNKTSQRFPFVFDFRQRTFRRTSAQEAQ